jgi:hypothetical protein
MDSLKDLSLTLKSKIKKQHLISPNTGEISTRKLQVKGYEGFNLRIDEFTNFWGVSITVNTALSFSVNRPDFVFVYKTVVLFENFPYQVYARSEELRNAPGIDELLPSFSALLKKINFSGDECIFLYRNSLEFIFRHDRDILSCLEDLLTFVRQNEKILLVKEAKPVSFKSLPAIFLPLVPLLKKYAISDDSEREEVVEKMSQREKSRLIKMVNPLFDEINHFLDSFKDNPLSDEAIALGNLAELVSEIMIET